MRPVFRTLPWLVIPLIAAGPACDESSTDGISEEEGQVSDLDALLDGAPDPSKLPDEPKSDATYPAKFDLVALQSPVRNQASRGVCSIFSTVALMEHLYIKEGTLKNPDFSEQYLQWSAKFEVGSYTQTEGSNADRNIEAINRFGIVDEAAWPYQTTRWTAANDARCTGDKAQPTLCYTNGEPTDAIKAATKWKLPRGRWVSSRRQSIKAFMAQNKQAVVAGMTFFYQSWNHRGSPLPVSGEYGRKGYILFPNDKDIETSKEKPAGHSILIVGWDDDLEVQRLDEKGEPMKDADGKALTEKGFFLIKNSWGTGNFGTENPFGAGYGWLSMKYVETYANVYGADVPKLDLGPENCNDGIDNNYNRLTDCEDSATCRTNSACQTADRVFESKPARAIPDDSPSGLSDTIAVDSTGTATDVWVEVDVAHTFIRDLKIVLDTPSGRSVTLYDRADTSGRDIRRRFLLPQLVGEAVQGNWKLTVSDNSRGDTGKLERWAIGLDVTGGTLVEICGDGRDNDGNNQVDCLDAACASAAACQSSGPRTLEGLSDDVVAIPDQSTAGVKSTIDIAGAGTITDVSVEIGITHSYRGDLTIKLIHPDGSTATILDQQGGSAQNVDALFPVSAFNGKSAAGTWTLWVVDNFSGDEGTLDVWMLEVDVK
ncbi:MAG: proprotein convertase P-domain-containing protein [Deltaproteobacteria bacterium]|nr:proprotein convertase P-domain-containing protein [Deltaproteobacteria bacterium]